MTKKFLVIIYNTMLEGHRKYRNLLNKLYRDLEKELTDQQDIEKIKRINQKFNYLIDDLVSRERSFRDHLSAIDMRRIIN